MQIVHHWNNFSNLYRCLQSVYLSHGKTLYCNMNSLSNGTVPLQ